MSELAAATKAPVTVDVGGRPIELSPLTMGDLGQFLRFVQFQDYEALKAVPEASEEELRASRIECAKKHVTLESVDFMRMAATPAGLVEFLFLSARHKHPEITRDHFGQLPLKKLEELNEILTFISGFVPKAGAGKAGESQKNGQSTLPSSFVTTPVSAEVLATLPS